MATVVKDFKIKSGLIVEGTSGTINGYDILTKKTADQNYIIGLIGGAATSEATPDTVVLRDENGDFSANVVTADLVGDVTGNADTATALETSRTIELTGDVTGSVSFDGTANVQISTTLDGSFATDAEVATAKGEAITAAGDYTDQEISDLDASLKLYADQAEADAIAAAALDATTKANAAEDAAKLYADGLAVNYDAAGSADDALDAAKAYTDQEVAALVDGAPALLDTLNELAAAIADNPNYATDVANLVASKADTTYVDDEIAAAIQATTYTAGTNIDITGNVVSVTGLDSADISDFNTAAVSANTGLWDTIGAASTAETNAKAYADGLAVNYDAAGAAATAESNANDYTDTVVGNLTTSDIEEGDNMYFTDARATNAAGVLLANASTTNVTVSYDSQNQSLTIQAENGVADSTTDDLIEGTSNLYFTDERAVDALQNTDSVFNTVSIDEVALQVAATLSAPTAGIQSAYTWNTADYTSAEFLVKVAYGTHTEVSKVLLTLDTSSNVAITEYAIVGTNGSASTISASVADGVVSLDVTTNNNNSTVTVVGTLLV